jgi:hypothetical protein
MKKEKYSLNLLQAAYMKAVFKNEKTEGNGVCQYCWKSNCSCNINQQQAQLSWIPAN